MAVEEEDRLARWLAKRWLAGELGDEMAKWLQRVVLLLTILLLIAGSGGLVLLWVRAPDLYKGKDPDRSAQATATTRAGILTVAAAGIAAGAAAVTLSETRRSNRNADQRDRYAKAIDQLGDENRLAVRLGGIYGLEQIARASIHDQRTVVEVLSAFIRERTQSPDERRHLGKRAAPEVKSTAGSVVDLSKRLERRRPTADVQAAITVLGRLKLRSQAFGADLTGADLTGLSFGGVFEFQRSAESLGLLKDRMLTIPRFPRRPNFTGAFLNAATLADTQLFRADLTGAWLLDADLTGAQLFGADLTNAHLDAANLTGTDLSGADLTGTDLSGATLTGAWLPGTNLARAKNLTQQQVDRARGDEDTQLPAGLQRPAHWSTGPAANQ